MRPKFIAANWKMHTTSLVARELARRVVDGLGDEQGVRVAICPPYPYLAMVAETLRSSRVALGAQNLFPEKEGAFTGEVSPTMLLDVGCRYVILGHSERRHILGETDRFINQKVKMALDVKLEVILCIGETLEQRQANQTEAILEGQLTKGLIDLQADSLSRLSVAYEPLWAIGKGGHHATPRQVHDTHAMIRDHFGRLFGQESARALCILYGGSVDPEDATSLLSQPGVDGALVGGASLDSEQFLTIVRAGTVSSLARVGRE